jgi:hypothetical protein
MAARSPRTRRRAAGSTLPRPPLPTETPFDAPVAPVTQIERTATPRAPRMREHHVTNDFSYVKGDLITVGVVSAIVLAFIIVMSFVV